MGVKMRRLMKTMRNENGMATIETIPLILLFVFMATYMLGAFGIIHTGIMHSISSRAYAFETFRNRTNLVWFRDNAVTIPPSVYKKIGNRTHGVMHENRPDGTDKYWPSERALRMGWPINPGTSRNDWELHNKVNGDGIVSGARNTKYEISPVWIMVLYGICLDNRCGD
jgi:hypothetical protein